MNNQGVLVLEDGSVFKGRSFGAEGESAGEIVFNTSMTGYQEVLYDPSYAGQLVMMTYPLIGNYGVNSEDNESEKLWLQGFIVKEYTRIPSNWRAREPLHQLLVRQGIVAIDQVDTRLLTKKIREQGAMQGILSTRTDDVDLLLERLKGIPGLVGRDLVSEVTTSDPYVWINGEKSALNAEIASCDAHVVVYDFGVKYNILNMLSALKCRVTVVPANTSADAVLALNPDGILLSNGPGDPEGLPYAIQNVKALLGKKPIFGICLGHQILALALGAKCNKMKFGHHGGNQPVMDLATKRVQITAQNHGFAIDLSEIKEEVEVTHINLNDKTLEGLRHRTLPVSSVQYHPEGAPGPHDAAFFFKRFVDSILK
ncbi:MAG: glutamine-hydrolyzing carbamoyl-phosphate synthase small subunit [Nitrospirae bacterium]|nr:glutamine-hydrolyzing carbamoyl-phosphate synthase small subunit [Candidatus Manganitrophaceae bacterium]